MGLNVCLRVLKDNGHFNLKKIHQSLIFVQGAPKFIQTVKNAIKIHVTNQKRDFISREKDRGLG